MYIVYTYVLCTYIVYKAKYISDISLQFLKNVGYDLQEDLGNDSVDKKELGEAKLLSSLKRKIIS